MFACYRDIMTKLGPPSWFDENAVPRYCEFHPHYLANIYADEAALLHVGCQVCEMPFIVAVSGHYPTVKSGIADHTIDYGDPPNVNCVNASISSVTLQVLQYWHRPQGQWERHPKHEVVIHSDWMSADEQQRRRESRQPPNSYCR